MEDNMENNGRRGFLKLISTNFVMLLAARKVLAQGAGAKPGGTLEMVKESDPQAQALGYYADAKKVDLKKWPKRAGGEGAKQFCYNCQFYQATGDAKKSKSAPCQILGMKGVTSLGWCNTWTQNPNVKG